MTLPQLIKEDGVYNLYVDGKPYIALAGEIHNSSASNLTYMKDKVWPNLKELHLNTVVLPVYWELIEPEQGQFDFHLLDGIIEQARGENVRLVLLWFGLWKNGLSSYVPGWVKKDTTTYFRAEHSNHEPSASISPLCENAVEADANAFSQLMTHLQKIDGDRHTVIMVQVENEIGFLGSDRDYSEHANAEFHRRIPAEVEALYGVSGTWEEAFAEDAAEYFMAYHYARAVERIASAGSKVYPLPLFVNAWLEQYPWRPGTYPSGGPIAKVMKLWKAAAPTICLYAPDIYLPNFAEVCEEYTANNENPLFIPEARRDVASVTNVFYALGKHNALCFSPFGIEDFLAPPSDEGSGIDIGLLMALNIDMSGFSLNGTGPYLARSYELLGNMLGVIQKYRGTGKMTGFLQNHDQGCVLSFSKYDIKVAYDRQQEGKPVSGGLVIEVSDHEFIFAGIGFSIEFLPKRRNSGKVGYVRIEEGTYVQDEWVRGRVLNGDEAAYRVKIGSGPSALRVEMYQYQ
jgi:Beta-galactosidase